MNALSGTETDIYDEIDALRRRKGATILAHYYQDGEIQELADYTGDSLKLARLATRVESPTIVFCGVHFMAETAKMLNPGTEQHFSAVFAQGDSATPERVGVAVWFRAPGESRLALCLVPARRARLAW